MWARCRLAGLPGLATLAVLGAAGGEARAAAAADTPLLPAAAPPRALERLAGAAAVQAATLPADGGLPVLRRDPLPPLRLIVAARASPAPPMPRAGTRQARLLLPVWVQMASGSWSIVSHGGYTLNPGPAARETSRSGFATIRTLSPRLSLGAEFSHDSPDLLDGHVNSALAVGARYRLTGPLSLMLAGGPYLEHQGGGTGMRAYAGLGIAF